MAPPVELRLGLIGYGTVGSAFATSLAERHASVERLTSASLRLAAVAVARPHLRDPRLTPAPLTGDAGALAADPSIDVLVEASGAPGAGAWIRTALERGATVVTANKQALARDAKLLAALAERDSRLHCEGAVAAAIPIVRALRESLAGEEIYALRGVLNGTTTFVLGQIEQQRSFVDAVHDAQAEGIAERDPANDLNGADAAAKLAILCSIAWREPVTVDQVCARGIDASIEETVAAARASGERVRLVAHAKRNGRIQATVEPRVLDGADALATGTGVHNVVEVHTALAGTLTWHGAGAGGRSTASALLADTISAARALADARTGAADTTHSGGHHR
ncbi:MAG TPA: homoserine dehydrogenase [Gemmatimonadaceae bacterium]|jgi:homoserine dehydrogenase|nr:homoserine dehydrogenase [Gemmatimonadaceae bacterium]